MAEKEETTGPKSIFDIWKKGDDPIIIDRPEGGDVLGEIKVPKVTDTQRKNTDKLIDELGLFEGIEDE